MTPISVATVAAAFQPTTALTILLTVESLLFAGLAAAVSLSSTTTLPVSPHAAARALALGIAAVLTAVAVGAGFAWSRLFVHAWPSRLDEQVPVICLAVGIAAQPIVAWIVVRVVYRR
jgi:hypothetical protein